MEQVFIRFHGMIKKDKLLDWMIREKRFLVVRLKFLFVALLKFILTHAHVKI